MRATSFVLPSTMAFALALTSGCAFGTRHAKITYPPDVKAKASTNTAPAAMHGRIALLPAADDRADKRLVGHVRNGFGMKTAEVTCDQNDLGALVTEAMRGEFARAGYEVVSQDSGTSADVPALTGSLTKVYCDAYMTYEGTVGITVRLNQAGKEVFRKSYEGKGSVGMNWGASGASYGRSISLALVDAIEALVRDLPTILAQTPPAS